MIPDQGQVVTAPNAARAGAEHQRRLPSAAIRAGGWRSAWGGVAIALLIFAVLAPTLPWLEFANGPEMLNVTTALEIQRTGHWLVPTLQGEARTQKPPLTAWITSAAIRDSTMRLMSSADATERARGERQLAWDARWTALLAACGMLLAVHALGQIIGGPRLGLASAAVCATTLLFLRYARYSTTDIQLALWVSVANALLAAAVLRGRWWAGFVLGGAAIGLAFMSKGPVSLVQTAFPVAAFAVWRRRGARASDALSTAPAALRATAQPRITPALVAGAMIMLAIALPWFAYVLSRASNENLLHIWLSEVSRVGATNLEPDPWYNYLAVVPYFFPWTVYLVGGLILGALAMRARSDDPELLALFLFVVPIALMSLFKDRKDRYLLPMLGPGAVVTASALLACARSWRELNRDERWMGIIHWLVVACAAVGMPLLAATGKVRGLTRAEGGPWFTWPVALLSAAAMLALVVVAIQRQRRSGIALVAGTALFMLVFQSLLAVGYSTSIKARSQMKPLAEAIWQRAPHAPVYNAMRNKRVPGDLSIYLNQAVTELSRAELRRAKPPYVVVMYQRADDPPPTPPARCELIARVPRGKHWWYAYVRD